MRQAVLGNDQPESTLANDGWAIGPFARPSNAVPVLTPDSKSVFDCPMREKPINWEALHTFNPAAVVKDGRVYMLYRAEDDTGDMAIGLHTSRLGLAISDDGRNFRRLSEPVLSPGKDDQRENEWDGGCEDPRIVETDDGTYVLTYTQWNRKVPRLAVATSRDLIHWKKYGPMFSHAHGAKYRDIESKAGAIVTSLQGGRLKAARIGGKYWMYWGEHTVRLAWSHDLISWTVIEDEVGEPLVVLAPVPGTFDSPLVEAGPPPILTDRGIVLLYNAKNDGRHRIDGLNARAYAGGQALFDAEDPAKLLTRLPTPFLKPELPWERAGQYGDGTTFIEGLVYFKEGWLLYYGCADSLVGVAMCDVNASKFIRSS